MGTAALISAVCLGAAYIGQFFFGSQPCFLCRVERIPYWIVVGSYGLYLFLGEGHQIRRVIRYASMAALLTGSSLALYHVGIEQQWWGSSELCGGGHLPSFDGLAGDASREIGSVKSCRDSQPFFLGLPASVYSLLASLAASAFLLFQREVHGRTGGREEAESKGASHSHG